MDIVSFQQEGRWFGLFLGSVADLIPTVFIDSVDHSSPILFGTVCYRQHSLLAIRLEPLLRPGRSASTSRRLQSPDSCQAASLLVVGRGEHLVGLPSESVACILDMRQERVITGLTEDDRGASRLRVQYQEREITVLDSTRLVRIVTQELGRNCDGPVRHRLMSQPC